MASVEQLPVKAQGEPVPLARALRRSVVADMIAQILFSQYCREEGVLMRLQDAPPELIKRFKTAGEFVTQFALHPDLERTAVMAAADLVFRSRSDGHHDRSIVYDCSRAEQVRYFKETDTAIRAYLETLVFRSPDAAKDADYCRLFDALEQKGLV